MRKYIAVAALTASLAGACGGGESNEFPEAIREPIKLLDIGLPGLSDILFELDYKEYNQTKLGEATIHFATVGEIEEAEATSPEIFLNATKLFESIASTDGNSAMPLFSADGTSAERLEFDLKVRNEDRYVLTIDGDMPVDDTATFNDASLALTNMRAEPLVTLLTAYSDNEASVPDPIEVFVEACQSAIDVETTNEKNLGLRQGAADLVAQEVVCNTLGAAAAAATLGVSYETYKVEETKSVEGVKAPVDGPTGHFGRAALASRDLYDALKYFKPISLDEEFVQLEAGPIQ